MFRFQLVILMTNVPISTRDSDDMFRFQFVILMTNVSSRNPPSVSPAGTRTRSPSTVSPAGTRSDASLLTTATRSILRCPYVCPGVTQSDTPSFSTKTSKCRTKSRTKLNFINLIGTPTDYNYVNNNSLLCIITNENNIDDHVSVCYAWHISYTCTSYDLGKERVYVSAVGTCTFFFFSFDCLLLV